MRPLWELKAFQKVELEPQQTAPVRFSLGPPPLPLLMRGQFCSAGAAQPSQMVQPL